MSVRSAVSSCEEDFLSWTRLKRRERRRFVQSRPNLSLDPPPIAEEIADLSTSQHGSLSSNPRRPAAVSRSPWPP